MSLKIENFTQLKKKLKNIVTRQCVITVNNEKQIGKKIKVFNSIGTESGNINSDVFRATHDTVELVIKKIPLYGNELKFIDKPTSLVSLNGSTALSELYFLQLLSLMVEQNICNFLPLLYKYFICDNCTFANKKVQASKHCLLLVSDKADYTLKKFLTTKHRIDEIISVYLQIYIGIYCMRKYLGVWHHDLHWNNILIYTTNPGGYWEYNINGKKVIVPNFGYQIVITDFGYSRIPGYIESASLQFIYKKESEPLEDYIRITNMLSSNKSYEQDALHNIFLKSLIKLGPIYTIIFLSEDVQKDGVGDVCLGQFDTTKKLVSKSIKIYKKPDVYDFLKKSK